MLRTRIITGLALAFLALIAIYLLPMNAYGVFWWVVGALGAWEYAGLAAMESRIARTAYVGVFTLLVIATLYLDALEQVGLLISAVLWALALVAVFTYPASGRFIGPRVTAVAGIFIMWAAWIALVVIREAPNGSNWMLWMVLVVAFADIGAYFTGRWLGRHKLAAAVSPGKTWEGFWGGMVVSSVICGGILVLMGRFNGGWIFIMVLLVTVSVVGDLTESVLKRERGVKDSGTLLPGHGGVLDRIDSAIAVLPYFALILIYAGLSDRAG
jgi:phosphatidate cytidylyltransferase